MAVATESEVQAVTRLSQVTDVGAPTNAVRIVERWWPDTSRVRVIRVFVIRMSEHLARFDERVLISVPLFALKTTGHNGAVGAVVIV